MQIKGCQDLNILEKLQFYAQRKTCPSIKADNPPIKGQKHEKRRHERRLLAKLQSPY